MFDNLLIEKILTFCPKARFVNKQFMKNYSYIHNSNYSSFKDMMTAFYCLLHGIELYVHDFYSFFYIDENNVVSFDRFVSFMITKLETLSDTEKIEFATNVKKILVIHDECYDNLDQDPSCSTFEVTMCWRDAHLLFDDVIKACNL